jgi:protein gp37
MSDLYHEDVPDDFIRQVFDTMRAARRHTFQLLTKRSERMADLAQRIEVPDNVWMGVSVENQRWASRIDDLRRVPAATRFLSCEPLLGPLELNLRGIHWVIVGGESGHRARRMHPEWVRDIRDQCQAAGVAFFFKQWGAYDECGVRRGKGVSGRRIDERTWDDLPTQPQKLSTVPAG